MARAAIECGSVGVMRLFGEDLTRRELMRRVGRLDQVAGVRLVTLGDGAERGVRLLEFRTGTGFEFDVVVDRAFDVGRCEHAGRRRRNGPRWWWFGIARQCCPDRCRRNRQVDRR